MGYSFINSKGVKYHLNTKKVTLRGGKEQRIYYFTKDIREGTAIDMPEGYEVTENDRNGFVTLRRKK